VANSAVREVVARELEWLLRGFDPDLHPRYPKGHALGGKFMKKGSADFKKAIAQAKDAAKDADKIETPADKAPARRKGKPKLPDQQAVERAYTGEFGRFKTGNVKARKLPNKSVVLVSGDVFAEGRSEPVGQFSRYVRKERDGSLTAVHELLELHSDVQGQGFAEALNASLTDWYRANGISRIELSANIDVGGYAWARAGYDWKDGDAAAAIFERVQAVADRPDYPAILPARRKEQNRLALDLLTRMDPKNFGANDYPTPFEVSQLGRWPGAGKDDWWAGKAILMGSDWEAVRQL